MSLSFRTSVRQNRTEIQNPEHPLAELEADLKPHDEVSIPWPWNAETTVCVSFEADVWESLVMLLPDVCWHHHSLDLSKDLNISRTMGCSARRRLSLTAVTVLLLSLVPSSLATYSIDDGILFRLNFNPSGTSTTEAASTATGSLPNPPTSSSAKGSSSEPSAVPADESLLGNRGKDL